MHTVCVFGSINNDMSVNCVRMPQKGETVLGNTFVIAGGGKGANQAAASARLGAKTFFVGKVGHDRFGSQLVSDLQEYGVNCSRTRTSSDAPTGSALILRSEGDNRIVVDPGANAHTTIEEVEDALDSLCVPGDIFLTQFECSREVSLRALKHASELGLFTICNPSPAFPMTESSYHAIDLLCLNETECSLLSGVFPQDDESTRSALDYFAARGVKNTIITLGAQGCIASFGGDLHKVPAYNVDVVDCTGAGDTFLGAICASLAYEQELEKALEIANAAAALCVTKLGAQPSIPTFDEVQSFLSCTSTVSE